MTATNPDLMVGKKYGRLTLTKKLSVGWLCNCSCGAIGFFVKRPCDFTNGRRKSCGCIDKERAAPKLAARKAGATRYFTGKPCVNGHISARMVSNGTCVSCLRLFRRSTPERRKAENKRQRRLAKITPDKRRHKNRRERLRPSQRLSRILRNRFNLAVKNNARAGSAVRDLGCTINELKQHLADKFTAGMSWDNYGKWEIDHKVPLAAFDLSDRQQVLIACHYTNLQPLWKIDNRNKGQKRTLNLPV